LSLGVIGQDDTKPVVQLGIKGRSEDGWYPLSTIDFVKQAFGMK